MFEHLSRQQQREVGSVLATLLRHSLFWPVALPLGLGLLFGIWGALVGLDPVDFAFDFIGESASDLSGPALNFWTGCFLITAFFFGVGKRLPDMLQHCALSVHVIPRLTQTIALWASRPDVIVTLSCGPRHRTQLLARPSRTELNTASDLAGSAPRLE